MIVPKTTQTGRKRRPALRQSDRFYREIWGEHVHHGLWRSGKETPLEASRP